MEEMCQKLIILSYSFVKVLKYDAMSTDSQHPSKPINAVLR